MGTNEAYAAQTCWCWNFSTGLCSGRKDFLRSYLLCTGWCWSTRREGTLISACLVRQRILNICIFVPFPLAFLKGKDCINEELDLFEKNKETKAAFHQRETGRQAGWTLYVDQMLGNSPPCWKHSTQVKSTFGSSNSKAQSHALTTHCIKLNVSISELKREFTLSLPH